jgi:hypothetical protein
MMLRFCTEFCSIPAYCAEMHGHCIIKLFLYKCGIIHRGAVLLQVRLQNVAVKTGHLLLRD